MLFRSVIGQGGRLVVAYVGKVKTAVQMVSITLLLYRDPVLGLPTYEAGLICLYVAALLTLWSMIIYLRAAWPLMTMAVPEGQHDERKSKTRHSG